MAADSILRRRPWRLAAVILALPLVLVLLAWGAVNLPFVRAPLAGLLAAVLSGDGVTVTIDRLDGALPQAPRLAGIRVADADGTWLTVDRVGLDWRPLALLRGRLALRELAVGAVRMERLPASSAARDGGAAGFPRLPLSVALDRLTVARVDLAAPVLGEPAAFAVEGRAASRAGAEVASSLRLLRLDGVAGEAVLSATLNAESGRLDVEASVEEPGNGLVASLLGLPGRPPLSIALVGAGTVEDWRGSLRAAAADLGAVDAKLQLDARGPVVADIRGTAELAMPLADAPRRLLGDHVDVRAVVAWDAAAFRLAVRDLSLTARAVAVTGQGHVDVETLETRLDLAARLLEAAAVADLLPGLAVAGAEVTASVSGPLSRPNVDLAVRLDRPAAEAASASGLVLESRLRPDRDLTAAGLRVGLDGSLRADGLAGLPPLAAGTLGDTAAATWTATADLAAGVVEMANLVAESGSLRAAASGAVDLSGGASDLGLTLRLDDVAPLAQAAGLAAGLRAGRGEAVAHLRGGAGRQGLAATVAGTLDGLDLADRDLSALLGGRLGFAAEVAGSLDGPWTVSDVSVEAGPAVLTGRAWIDPAAGRLDATYAGRFADLARLTPLAGLPLQGALALEGTAKGEFAAPAVTARVSVADARVGATGWQRIVLDAAVAGPVDRPRGKLTLAADGPLGALRAAADVARAADGRIAVSGLKASGAGLDLAGDLTVAPAGRPLAGTLRLQADDLGPLGALAGLDLAGSGSVALDLAAARDGGQRADARLALRRLALREDGRPAVTVAGLEATAAVSGTLADPHLKIAASATDTASGALRLATFRAEAEGGLTRLAVSYRLDGRVEAAQPLPLTVALDGVVARDGDAVAVDVSRFQGRLAGRPFALRAPAAFRYAEDAIVAGPLALDLDQGRLEAALRLDAAAVALSVEGSALPLDLVRLAVPGLRLGGTLTASVSLSGPPQSPDGRFRLAADGVMLADASTGELPPLAVTLEGTVAAGRLAARAAVAGLPATTVSASLDAPVALSLRPPAAGLAPGGSLAGRLKVDGDVGAVWALLPIDPHRLGGRAAVDLAVAGRPGDLRLDGSAGLTGGVYENLETGTLLNDLTVEMAAAGRRLDLVRATARDALGGSLDGRGYLDVSGAASLLALRVSLANLRLVHRDDISATVSGPLALDGALALDGSPSDLRLSGALVADPVEARLVDRLPPGIVSLGVVEVGGPATAAAADETAAVPLALALDLAVDMPRRFFVRGRGLDSEWAGNLRIAGTAAAPRVAGTIVPVRGQFDLAGKVFRLNEGSIRFAGGEALVPDLDLSLEHQGASIRAILRITGPANDPKLALRSVPELPQEEILSRVLFDRDTGSLSAGQALQLANAAATLTGVGGIGLLDSLRARLGVDVLRLGGDSQGASLTAGRYLGDRVFVGATQGTSPESTAATVEVEITPNITVETDIGQNAKSRVGVKWKWDY